MGSYAVPIAEEDIKHQTVKTRSLPYHSPPQPSTIIFWVIYLAPFSVSFFPFHLLTVSSFYHLVMGSVHIMDNSYIMYQQTAHTNPVILQVSLHQAYYVRLPWELSLCTSQIRSFITLWTITACMYLHYHRALPSRCLNEDSKTLCTFASNYS